MDVISERITPITFVHSILLLTTASRRGVARPRTHIYTKEVIFKLYRVRLVRDRWCVKICAFRERGIIDVTLTTMALNERELYLYV